MKNFRFVRSTDHTSITDAQIETLRVHEAEYIEANKVRLADYDAKGKAILEAIAALFPLEHRLGKKDPIKSTLYKQAEKAIYDNRPRLPTSMSDFQQFVDRVVNARQEHAQSTARQTYHESIIKKVAQQNAAAIRLGALRGWMDIETVHDFIAKAEAEDKYLRLANAMAYTRGDCSEGFWRVEEALESFVVESEQDAEIAACVADGFGDTDGRVFRDMRWNYDALYELVAADLMAVIRQFYQ